MMTQKMKKDQVKKFFLILQKNNITEKVRSKNSITDQKKKKKEKKRKTKQNTRIRFIQRMTKKKGESFMKKCKSIHEVVT